MEQLDKLNLLISNHRNNTRTIANAESLLKNTKPLLAGIANHRSVNDPDYLKYSTEIISIAIDNITRETETAKATAEKKRDQYPEEADIILRITYSNAWAVLKTTENMYMDEKFMTEQYYPFRDSILDYCSELGISEPEEDSEMSAWQIIVQFIGWAQFVIYVLNGEISIKTAFIVVFIVLIIWIYRKNSKKFKW